MLGSVRLTVFGQRTVLLAAFSRLEKFAKGCEPSGAQLALSQVLDRLSNADDDVLRGMVVQGVVLRSTVLTQHTLLSIPLGWVLVERTDNAEDTGGARWFMAADSPNDGFIKLAHLCTPQTSAAAWWAHTTSPLLSTLLLAFDIMAQHDTKRGFKLEQVKREALAVEVAKRPMDGQEVAAKRRAIK